MLARCSRATFKGPAEWLRSQSAETRLENGFHVPHGFLPVSGAPYPPTPNGVIIDGTIETPDSGLQSWNFFSTDWGPSPADVCAPPGLIAIAGLGRGKAAPIAKCARKFLEGGLRVRARADGRSSL